MPLLAHYEVTHNGRKVVLLLTEKDAAQLGGKLIENPADIADKMREPRNKARL